MNEKGVTAAQHGERLCVVAATCSRAHLVYVSAGPVAHVLASLFEDFRKKFNAWVDSV